MAGRPHTVYHTSVGQPSPSNAVYFDLLWIRALTPLLVWRQEERPACKKLSDEVLICLERGADLFAYGLADAIAPQNPTISCLI